MFPNENARNKYRQVQITTNSPGKTLMMLFAGLFKLISDAKLTMATGERVITRGKIHRAHAILEELVAALDRKAAPDLCDQLEPLYVFTMAHLLEANIKQDVTKLDDCLRILTPVREAFETVTKE